MREAVKGAFTFLAAPAWSDYVVTPVGSLTDANNDAKVDSYITENAQTIFHPTCTAGMSHVSKWYAARCCRSRFEGQKS